MVEVAMVQVAMAEVSMAEFTMAEVAMVEFTMVGLKSASQAYPSRYNSWVKTLRLFRSSPSRYNGRVS